MKTRNYFRLSAVLFLALGLTFTSCKKDKDETDSSSMTQLTKDEADIQSSDDEAMNDVNSVLTKSSNKSIEVLPKSVTIDSTSIANDTITYNLTYTGTNWEGTRSRSGQVIVKRKIGESWVNPGAKVMVKFVNFRVTKISNNKSVLLNGTKTFENVSGGKLEQLGNPLTSITHKVYGSLVATFDDNSTRTWNVARQRVFTGTGTPLSLVCTVSGFGEASGYSNLVVWGTNRNGEAFYTQINTAIVFKAACNWEPSAGVKVHQIPSDSKKVTATFGYTLLNQPIGANDCAAKFKVDWERNGNTGTVYFEL